MVMRLRAIIACVLLVAACANVPDHDARQRRADAVAASGKLAYQQIAADGFTLSSYRRIGAPGAATTIYIEGDGYAWAAADWPSTDPTPTAPIALELAAKDDAANVIYLARPCQYVGAADAQCKVPYWTGARFAPEVIRAYGHALDQIRVQTGASGFQLVGFSGGGAVALLLASERNDILNVRTVSGNVNHKAWTELHGITPLAESLDAADVTPKLTNIPQLHFVGADDDVMPIDIANAYKARFSDAHCVSVRSVANATHTDGWASQWPELLRIKVACGDGR